MQSLTVSRQYTPMVRVFRPHEIAHNVGGCGGKPPEIKLYDKVSFYKLKENNNLFEHKIYTSLFKEPPRGQGSLYDPYKDPKDKNLQFRITPIKVFPQVLQKHILSFLSTEQVRYLQAPGNYLSAQYHKLDEKIFTYISNRDQFNWDYKPLSIIGYRLENPHYVSMISMTLIEPIYIPESLLTAFNSLDSNKLNMSPLKFDSEKYKKELEALISSPEVITSHTSKTEVTTRVIEPLELEADTSELSNSSSNKCVIL